MKTRAFTLASIGGAALLLLLVGPGDLRAQESGVELWGRTCNRCHNVRPIAERTDRDWATIVMHMRARANLTKSGAQAILEFLQAANEAEVAVGVEAPPVEPATVEEPPEAPPPEPAPIADRIQALVGYFQYLVLGQPLSP